MYQIPSLFTFFSFLAATSALSIPHSEKRATTCNGFEALCSRAYDSVSFVGAHDSYAIGSISPATNQEISIDEQLNLGVRLLQAQAHWISDDHLQLCHTKCALEDGGSLLNWLKQIKTWLDGNPNDVLTLVLVNSDNRGPADFAADFKNAGLDTMSYVPTAVPQPYGQWPTLGEMIDSGKRVVTFIDYDADQTVVPYLLNEFTHVWETPYDVTDKAFPCTVARIDGDKQPETHLYMINHFLDTNTLGILTPDRGAAGVTNSGSGDGNLLKDAEECKNTHGRFPNFLLLDFVNRGTAFDVAKTINGV